MRATFLIDNISSCSLASEWGLAVFIEYHGHKILLDTGAGPLFTENAAALGADLTQVEFGVLSHAHSDHAGGMETFFQLNHCAPFYLQAECKEDCFDLTDEGYTYAGIRRGLLGEYADRIRYVDGWFSPLPGVTLLPHSTPGLEQVGLKGKMFRQTQCCMVPDNFAHEQSLIFETDKGLVIFNSCCHAGADVIVREAAAAFPGSPLYAIIGGFHLFETSADEVRAFAHRLQETGVERIVTGHCTGEDAFVILKDVLGDHVQQMETGLVLELS